MPYLSKKRVWTQQSQRPSRISDKFSRYLPFAGNNNLSIVNNESIATISPSIYGHGVPVVTPGGMGAYYDNQRSSLVTHNTLTNVYTLFAICYGIRESAERHFLDDDGSVRKFQFRQKSNSLEFIPFDISGTPYFPTISLSDDTILSSTVPRIFVAVARGHSGGGDIYIGSQKASASFSNIAPLSSSFLVGGYKDTPFLYDFSGPMAILGYAAFASKIPDDVIFDVIRQPWQLFKRQDKRIWVPSAGGGSSTNLIIQDSTHSLLSDNLDLSTSLLLTIQDSTHSLTSDNLTLSITGSTDLIIQEATHSLTSDNLLITTEWLLDIASAAHALTSDNLDLSTALSIIIQNAIHSHTADNLVLDTSNTTLLTIQDAVHNHTADNLDLTLDTWLVIANAIHSHLADSIDLGTELTLTIQDSTHNLTSDIIVLSIPSTGSCPTVEEIVAAIMLQIEAKNYLTLPQFLSFK